MYTLRNYIFTLFKVVQTDALICGAASILTAGNGKLYIIF